ncbi:alkyl/aryl-sulfatase [Leifsonia sp. NPDC014704]|uniref:alkyl/aryl-sulfatase n=1 Tax=Leifsonia sp. NPDC014704 TaxID=3364123 RepID=UPI0036F453BE
MDDLPDTTATRGCSMQQNDPAPSIREAHRAANAALPFSDDADFAAAERGFLGTLDDPAIRDASGTVVWDTSTFGFLDGDAPLTVHPSLWRQGKLVLKNGLFEVTEGLYQVRGLDLSVMSFIEGDSGVIVVDPLLTKETAAAALGLYRRHRGDRPIVAVIFTHSHLDHFGGVLGIVSGEEVEDGRVEIVAPAGFIEHSISENVYAGTAMARRAGYMYGAALDRGPSGQVGAGLGLTLSTGETTLLVPTIDVAETGERLTFDGVEFEFQLAPNTEAPAEMHFFIPRYNALCMAENATHNLHNLLTLRGALVRDPHVWSEYLTEAIERYGDRADVLFTSHHWPTWGREELVAFLRIQRDLYGYLHDQTLRLLNRGLTGTEIAEELTLPPALEREWSTRGYYGSVSHNVKAIAQRYLGWFDGNPARLWPHPPQALAERYVRALGGVERVVELAQAAYDDGDFRWAATLLDHAVFTEPDSAPAKSLYADTLEQLAYGSENATWRNFFLSGATELREGNFGTPTAANAPAVLAELTPEQIFDSIAITVDGPNAWELDLSLEVVFSDLGRTFHLTLTNGVLIHVERRAPGDVPLRLTITKPDFLALLGGDPSPASMSVEGDAGVLQQLTAVLQRGDPGFNIVLP